MLRKIRIVLAGVFFICLTLLLLGIGHQWFGWMARIQFLPSCLALNFAAICGILLLTLLFGRIYCSVICPMGVLQDIISSIRRKFSRRKKHFKPHEGIAADAVRYIVVTVFVILLICGVQVAIALLAPYSAYGRIVGAAASAVTGRTAPAALFITGGLTLAAIALCAWFTGRGYCNTVCPVGTILSLLARISVFKIRIDEDKCVSCGKCGRGCKASCIDTRNRKIDYSRCVDCFDCIDNCRTGAISFSPSLHGTGFSAESAGRRNFLTTTAALVGSATLGGIAAGAQEKRLDGGLADIEEKKAPARCYPIVPPGAVSAEHFYDHCTACQLCIDNCPNDVLRPSGDLRHLLQPQMGYEKGFCRPECTVCSELCPAGAILPVTREEKTAIHIGIAEVDADSCTGCGKCKSVCPTGAALLVKREDGSHIAAVSEELCIGCGKCEFLCPVRPLSAIKVNGLKEHRNG